MVVFLVLLGLLYTAIRSHTVINKTVYEVLRKMSSDLNTEITVGEIEIGWWKSITLKEVMIKDQQHDTLIAVKRLDAQIQSFSLDNRIIELSNIMIDGAHVHFEKPKNMDTFNFVFFIRYLTPPKRDPNKPKVIWNIKSEKVLMSNSSFRYQNQNSPPPLGRRFNENFMEYGSINAELEDFKIIGDSLHFKSTHLEAKERSGLTIENLRAITNISKHTISLKELTLKTPNSILKDEFVLRYSSYLDMSQFIDKVKMETSLHNSKVSMSDIAYFYEPFWGNKDHFIISGQSEGVISNLDAKSIHLIYGQNTTFKGKFDFTGLPDVYNTLLDIKVKSLNTTAQDLGNLFGEQTAMEQFKVLEKINFQGNLVGFTHDFITRGIWKTALGNAKTDLNFKYTDKKSIEEAIYKGTIETAGFNLKPLLPEAQIGLIDGSLSIEGSGLSLNNINSTFEAKIKSIEITDKLINNLTASGELAQKSFNGKAKSLDKNANLDFNGLIDFTQQKPVFKLESNINNLNLTYFDLDTGISVLSGILNSNMEGANIDQLNGVLSFNNGILSKGGQQYKVDFLNLEMSKKVDSRTIKLNSNIAAVDIEGNYALANLPSAINHILHTLSPAYFPRNKIGTEDRFNFDINIKEPDIILSYLPSYIKFGPIKAKGFFNSEIERLNAVLRTNNLNFQDIKFANINVSLKKEANDAMFVSLKAGSINKDTLSISDGLTIEGKLSDNNILFDLKSKGNKLNYTAEIAGNALLKKDTIEMSFNKSSIKVHDREWVVNKEGKVSFINGVTNISNLLINTSGQSLALNGKISKDIKDELRIDFDNLFPGKLLYDLAILKENQLQGVADGWLSISKLYETPLLQSDFSFKKALWEEDTLGDFDVKVINSGKDKLIVDGTKVTSGPFTGLEAKGSILLNSKKDNYALSLTLPKSKINIVETFLKGLVSDVSGFAQSERLYLTGKFDEPSLSGVLNLKAAKFKIDYLGTNYFIEQAKLEFSKNSINIIPLEIRDIKNHTAKIEGSIAHNYFNKWKFDIKLKEIKNMQLLNTTAKENDLFYGEGYGSGYGFIKGPLEGIDIYLKAKTEKGTRVTLPLEDSEASSSVSYINFKQEETSGERKAKAAFSNINSIVVDIETTKDAIAEIVFDSKVGDVMKGSTEGVLKFEVNKSADFFMYGSLKVIEGDYLFTAFNFINKPFSIEPGGTIFWDGDPYNAKIDITAVYKQMASLAPLVDPRQFGTTADFEQAKDRLRTPIRVNSKIIMDGILFEPKIGFDIEFPNLGGEGNSNVEITTIKNKLANDPQEMNKQFLSLLVFNRFLPVSFENIGSIAVSAPGQSASEMISAQLNNWMSDLGIGLVDNISLDLGKDTANQRELVVSAEKTLFNERLTIRGAYGNRVGSNATNVSVEYNITKDGNLKLRTNYTPFYYSTIYTNTNQQGLGGVRRGTVGVFYRREFETIRKTPKKKQD